MQLNISTYSLALFTPQASSHFFPHSKYIIDRFEDFLTSHQTRNKESGEDEVWDRRACRLEESIFAKFTLSLTFQPFLAVLWLHTNHIEHIALPEYFNAYKDVFGKPAGDCMFFVVQ